LAEVSQVDVAPTAAEVLGFSFRCSGKPISQVLEYARGCRRVLLAILDGLGYMGLLEHLEYTRFLREACAGGVLLKCRPLARVTTPAIASILTGLPPRAHSIYRTEDAYSSRLKSMPEVASELGIPAAIVMEPRGAGAFQGRVSYIFPVAEAGGVGEVDLRAARLASRAAEVARLVVLHLRSVDRLGYTRESFKLLDLSLELAYRSFKKHGRMGDGLLLACGDHPPHGSSERLVPLLAYR